MALHTAKSTVKAAGVRALRTFLQVLIPALGAGALTELNYLTAASIAGGAAVISFLQGVLAGLPEAVDFDEWEFHPGI